MSDEITIQHSLRVNNPPLQLTGGSTIVRFDQATRRAASFTVDIGTVEETISFGDVVPGYVRAVNLNATNFVKLRFSAGVDGPTLDANGGVAIFKMPTGGTLRAIADTAACAVQFEAANV